MGKIQELPGGKKFTAQSWQKKFKENTSYGQLSSLKDNQEALNSIAKKRASTIRSGSYDIFRRRADYQEILKMDKNLNNNDKKSVKGILDHWAVGPDKALKKDISSKPESKRGQSKSALRRETVDFSPDSSLSFPSNDASQSRNTPYGGINPRGNYFPNSVSPLPSSPKPPSNYKPPRLSV